MKKIKQINWPQSAKLLAYLNGIIIQQAIDEVVENIFCVLRMALDAKNMISNCEHFHSCFIRKSYHCSTYWNFPNLIPVTLHY